MVGRPYDCLVNPLGAVRLTFEKAVSAGADPTTFGGRDWGATDLFRNYLYDEDAFSQVPLLSPATVHTVQPNTLVRFRGMIQDMLGTEFYVGAYKDGVMWNTNKFTDISQSPITSSSSDTLIWERRLLYCIPVPGQNDWTKSYCDSVINRSRHLASSPLREKRQREYDATSYDMDMQVMDQEFHNSPYPKKMREDVFPAQSSSNPGVSKTVEGTSDMTIVDQNSCPCLVKIYNSPESDLKLNEVFEFVGVLTFDPELTADNNNSSDGLANNFCEDELVHLPPSKVPRIHCIVHRKLAVHDFLPRTPTLELKLDLVRGIRDALLGHLTAVLGNDGLGAQFVLLHLLSRVHTRASSIAVGKLSLNLTCFSNESMSIFGNRLKLAIKNLLPFTHYIPLTVDYLNNASFAPRKDYEMNRLVTGVLQLAEGAHLIIDETKLQTGTLHSVGIENTRLLKNLLEFQKVEYDFKYYKMEMEADAQVLILSEAKSNILPADLVVPFCPTSVDSCEIPNAEETLKAWRWYLATLRSLPHSIGPEMQKVVEDDLVAARQADRSLGSEDFSRWLTMGRLMSMSYGETSLSMQHWQMVKELERLRCARFH